MSDFFQSCSFPVKAGSATCRKIHSGQKSQLTSILEKHITLPDQEPEADDISTDRSALVHELPPKRSKTFADYAALDFLPRISAYANAYKTTHVVFDVYSPSSLKADTRPKRGQGGKHKVTEKNIIPSNLQNFLRHKNNKSGLFHFLAYKIVQMSVLNLVIVTKGPQALSTHKVSLAEPDKCSHEEADSRTFVHARQRKKIYHSQSQ